MKRTRCSEYLQKLFISCTLVTFIAGCSRAYIPLSDDLVRKIGPVEAISIIVQDHAEPTVDSSATSGAMAGGAIFGLVGVAVAGGIAAGMMSAKLAADREKISNLESSMDDFDFRTIVRKGLRDEISRSNYLQIVSLGEQNEIPSKKDEERLFEETDQEALLLLYTEYYMSPDHRVLTIRIIPEIWSKENNNRVYSGQITFFSRPIEIEEDELAFAVWGENGGLRYRQVIQEGIDELAGIFRMEFLESTNNHALNEKFQATIKSPLNGERINIDGTLLKKEQDRLWVQTDKGEFISIHCEIVELRHEFKKVKYGEAKLKDDEQKRKLTHC